MTKQELFKQADYTFQRGNRELAKKYLSEYLAAHPNDEAAWMLMARIVEDTRGRVECYERVLKINPNNNEAKIALVRVKSSINPTLPRSTNAPVTAWIPPKTSRYKTTLRGALMVVLVLLLSGTSTFVIASNNPDSKVAQMLAVATPTLYSDPSLVDGIAPQTRAEVDAKYPQYSQLVEVLLALAVENAGAGMEGAPERPGAEIMVSEKAGVEAVSMLESALPQPGSLSSITITEQQATSWLAMEMKDSPDLPLSDVQIYLRNGKVQVWGVVNGGEQSTSALIVGVIAIDNNKQPHFKIESIQVGGQVIPAILVTQVESWLNQALAEQINSRAPGLELMNINVTSGLITVSGMR